MDRALRFGRSGWGFDSLQARLLGHLESVLISVSGGIIGIILGMIASIIIAKLLVSTVTPWSIFIAFGFSVMIGIIFGMAPAIRASKLNPIDALRYE